MSERYDGVVVGSGATGGWAAKELTESGLRIAVLEAGPLFPLDVDLLTPRAPEAGERQPIQSQSYALTEQTSFLFVDDVENPYSVPEGKPFSWIRGRQVGGRLHVWGRTSIRMSDYELKAADRDGIGEPWPISYADLAPYYDRVERFMGVCGVRDGLPQLPDGSFLPAPPLTAGEQRLKTAIERRWKTRRLTTARFARRSSDATLAAAMRTGRLTLYPDSVASHVIADAQTGRARGVAFVDGLTGHSRELYGRVIVLCASTIESTRLLLNSATPEHPNGLANSSGVLGHYLMDHTDGIVFEGVAPQGLQRFRKASDRPRHGGYIPAFRNVTEHDVDFVRGYGIELEVNAPGGRRGGGYWMSAFGEVLPVFENNISLDRDRTDAWGIPIAHIDCSYGENERRMARDEVLSLQAMLDAAGFCIEKAHTELAPPGLSAHEMGTARMGGEPGSSVLNSHNQSWDVENLFVTDGACFTSSGFQNPTLTMMAITVRACEYIVSALRSGRL